ncbi:HEAT repeat domain-containing protein [Streptomyces sp. G45]|uniref:HEAT repeat domain-containing protein n=1 Tax=Streptomyces sp. G45 TaxID=3406627 RepID=UPI003C14D1D2
MRRAAARALGAYAGAAATEVLLEALGDAQVSDAVAEVVARFREPPVRELLALLTDADRGAAQRRGAARALGLAGCAEAAPPLLAVVADGEAATALRATAVDALGTLRHAQAAAALAALAEDEAQPGTVRARAVRALGLIGAPETLPVVLACLRAPHEAVRARAVDALAGFPVPEAADTLGALAGPGTARETAVAAVRALHRVGAPALPVLTALADGVREDIADYLVAALRDRPEAEATLALGRVATSAEAPYPAQVAATEALSARGTPECVAPLASLLTHTGVWGPVYAAAMRGLVAIGTPEAHAHVLAYCRASPYLNQNEEIDALHTLAEARRAQEPEGRTPHQ